jgi:hypothetical protein
MARKRQRVQTRLPASPEEKLRRKILAADFGAFPGDIGKFADEELRGEGLLDAVRQLEKAFAAQDVIAKIEEGLLDIFSPSDRRHVYRWLCLAQRQNHLQKKEITRLRVELKELEGEYGELRNEMFEGTMGLWFKAMVERRDVWSAEFQREEQRTQQTWREQKQKAGARPRSLN